MVAPWGRFRSLRTASVLVGLVVMCASVLFACTLRGASTDLGPVNRENQSGRAVDGGNVGLRDLYRLVTVPLCWQQKSSGMWSDWYSIVHCGKQDPR